MAVNERDQGLDLHQLWSFMRGAAARERDEGQGEAGVRLFGDPGEERLDDGSWRGFRARLVRY